MGKYIFCDIPDSAALTPDLPYGNVAVGVYASHGSTVQNTGKKIQYSSVLYSTLYCSNAEHYRFYQLSLLDYWDLKKISLS